MELFTLGLHHVRCHVHTYVFKAIFNNFNSCRVLNNFRELLIIYIYIFPSPSFRSIIADLEHNFQQLDQYLKRIQSLKPGEATGFIPVDTQVAIIFDLSVLSQLSSTSKAVIGVRQSMRILHVGTCTVYVQCTCTCMHVTCTCVMYTCNLL